jgi:peptidoglycan/xylan/chitin deacetylase (PgdA/CDA1 family)
MPQRGIVFLMYHELEIPGRPLCRREAGYRRYVLTEQNFRSQIRWLEQAEWRGMNVTESFALGSRGVAEQNAVVITFDDGCETDLIVAAPILKEAGFTATFYVTVGFLGQRGYMNAMQLRELSALGFEIGCHSMTHAYLTDLDDNGLRREIVDAKTQLEEILGKPVEHFACPGGRYDARSIQVARDAGYCSLSTSRIQMNVASTDRYELGRIAILRDTVNSDFQQLCNGEEFWKRRFREHAQNVAKQLLGNSLYDRGRGLLLRGE